MSADKRDKNIEALSISDCPRLSVLDDYEHIANELLETVNEELIETKCVHWDIENWLELPDRAGGPEFEAGGHRWNILLFPKGSVAESFVSVYLQWTDRNRDPLTKKKGARAQFALCLSTPSQPTNYLGYGTDHIFTSEQNDWGFAHHIEVEYIDQKNWRTDLSPLLEDNRRIRVSIMIRVLKNNDDSADESNTDQEPSTPKCTEPPILSSNDQSTSSSVEENLTLPIGTDDQPVSNSPDHSSSSSYEIDQPIRSNGIKSMDGTGCLSIILQLLYYTACFRKDTYELSSTNSCDALTELLRVFNHLLCSPHSVDATELIKSLGWDYEYILIQRDIVQFRQALQNALELECPAFAPLYQKTFGIRYTGGGHDDEYRYEVSLEITDHLDLQEALFDHVFNEEMVIRQLPPVLYIHLRRFWYNYEEGHLEKINDRFTYPLEIVLDPFVDSSNERLECHTYVLQSVVVHDEELSSGIYYAHIRPTCNGSNWIKIEDHRITPSCESDALENSYGGSPPDELYEGISTHNAYMLSYVRKSQLQEVFDETSNDSISDNRASSSTPSLLYTSYILSIATDVTFQGNFSKVDVFDPSHRSIKLLCIDKSTTTLNSLETAVSELFEIPREQFRLWTVLSRQNKTIRPHEIIESQDKEELVTESIITRCVQLEDQSFFMYLETPIGPQLSSLQILLFIKYFDIENPSIRGIGHIIVDAHDQVGSISSIINALIGAEIDMHLDLYEELAGPTRIDLLQSTTTFADAEIQHGDIICAQKHLSDQEKYDMQGMYLDAPSFYAALL